MDEKCMRYKPKIVPDKLGSAASQVEAIWFNWFNHSCPRLLSVTSTRDISIVTITFTIAIATTATISEPNSNLTKISRDAEFNMLRPDCNEISKLDPGHMARAEREVTGEEFLSITKSISFRRIRGNFLQLLLTCRWIQSTSTTIGLVIMMIVFIRFKQSGNNELNPFGAHHRSCYTCTFTRLLSVTR